MKKNWMPPIIIFLVIMGSFVYYYVAVVNALWPISVAAVKTLEEKGQLGDAFGGFTSLFSALAFGGVLFTLWYQHQTLQENKKSSDIRQFESILFNLLSVHNAILQDMDIQNGSTREFIASGRDCFHRYVIRHLKPAYKRLKNVNLNGDELELAKDAYATVWLRHRHNLSHYLRYIYNIFKFIDTSEIPPDLKKKYSSIVRSQLSDYELLIVFYNCLHENGSERFKPLVERYAIFNNLPTDLLLNPTHRHFYSQGAY